MKKLQFLQRLERSEMTTTIRRHSPFYVFLISLLFLTALAPNTEAQTGSQRLQRIRIAELRKALVESKTAPERSDAARLLAQLGDRQSIKLLIKSTVDPEAEVRVQAILALGQLRARDAVPVLIKILTTNNDSREKKASAFALGIIRDRRAVEPLTIELKTADPQLQQNIVVALGLLGDPRAVEPLLALPHDEDHDTCAPIAIALGQIKSNVPADRLFDWLNSDDADVCPNAAIALVLIGGKRQVTPLIKVLSNKNPVSRRSAAFALGALNDTRAVLPLIDVLMDSNVPVRLSSIAALVLLRDKRAIAPLSELAKSDPDLSVRHRAAQAIQTIQAEIQR